MATFPIGTAAVSWVDTGGVHLRVYSTDGYTVTERCYDGSAGWTTGGFSQAGGAVSATSWEDGGIHIRVYCNFEDKTVEWCYDPGGSWYQGAYTID